mmetsp:Transcript_7885/g.25219  ORF Transcript_7885/g.25219 Transcript_7885/m.25219 type:complete len:346 (-) Transcript_7885:476-1513(-)
MSRHCVEPRRRHPSNVSVRGQAGAGAGLLGARAERGNPPPLDCAGYDSDGPTQTAGSKGRAGAEPAPPRQSVPALRLPPRGRPRGRRELRGLRDALVRPPSVGSAFGRAAVDRVDQIIEQDRQPRCGRVGWIVQRYAPLAEGEEAGADSVGHVVQRHAAHADGRRHQAGQRQLARFAGERSHCVAERRHRHRDTERRHTETNGSEANLHQSHRRRSNGHHARAAVGRPAGDGGSAGGGAGWADGGWTVCGCRKNAAEEAGACPLHERHARRDVVVEDVGHLRVDAGLERIRQPRQVLLDQAKQAGAPWRELPVENRGPVGDWPRVGPVGPACRSKSAQGPDRAFV